MTQYNTLGNHLTMMSADPVSGLETEFGSTQLEEHLNRFLSQWDMSVSEVARGYKPYSFGFTFQHGLGYDYYSADLLGGNANGDKLRAYIDWDDAQ